jgi:hypothetical protein
VTLAKRKRRWKEKMEREDGKRRWKEKMEREDGKRRWRVVFSYSL